MNEPDAAPGHDAPQEVQHSASQPAGPWQLVAEHRIASQPGNEHQAMRCVTEAVSDLHLPQRDLERLRTAVAEATMNAMEHGNRYRAELPVVLEVLLSPAALAVRVTDHGGWQMAAAPEAPDLEAKLAGRQSPRGWGLFLIERLVDLMRVSSDGERHTLELIVYLEEAPMAVRQLEADVRRVDAGMVLDLRGEINASSEATLDHAYAEAERQSPRVILLNFGAVEYINSTGIALIVGLLARAYETQRPLLAYGLSDHYVEIFRITRLADFMQVFPDEAGALAAARAA
jgi:anti-anti-sigma factor